MPILQYAGETRSAVLVMHGEKVNSCYFSRDAFAKLTGGNKELLIIPSAIQSLESDAAAAQRRVS